MKKLLIIIFIILLSTSALATDWYVSDAGAGSKNGTLNNGGRIFLILCGVVLA
jgi:hypothetical protein